MTRGAATYPHAPVPATQRMDAGAWPTAGAFDGRQSGVRPAVRHPLDDTVDDLSLCVAPPAGLSFGADISDLYTEDHACLTVDVTHSGGARVATRIGLVLGAFTCVGIGATIALLTLL